MMIYKIVRVCPGLLIRFRLVNGKLCWTNERREGHENP